MSIAKLADRISRIMDGVIRETVTPAELRIVEEVAPTLHERVVDLENKKRRILEEIERLKRALSEDRITADEFVERYMKLKEALKDIEAKLSKIRI